MFFLQVLIVFLMYLLIYTSACHIVVKDEFFGSVKAEKSDCVVVESKDSQMNFTVSLKKPFDNNEKLTFEVIVCGKEKFEHEIQGPEYFNFAANFTDLEKDGICKKSQVYDIRLKIWKPNFPSSSSLATEYVIRNHITTDWLKSLHSKTIFIIIAESIVVILLAIVVYSTKSLRSTVCIPRRKKTMPENYSELWINDGGAFDL